MYVSEIEIHESSVYAEKEREREREREREDKEPHPKGHLGASTVPVEKFSVVNTNKQTCRK